ncbi:N-acetyl-gamma-glutamyl-phosphate reductase [Candidatus Laterigemmans baculatus]|uniref:N-acetyl-gamma-glutamyl-phosphate reductase n=1 Tax=Candidatus Laterigemmans baculatus TaxID=2770505 RepID=UPI0013DA5E60|nr:N-acetyl-gamma-glutamyl-phosphate reductase [Candidatus Laterigemmans baculatus]
MTPIRVGILGATGYTALEAIRLLLTHPQAQVTVATSRQEEGQSIASIHPQLTGRLELPLSAPEPAVIAQQCDVAFCCLPHGASAETVRQLAETGLRVIDFSADFRLGSVELYRRWYGGEHPWPEMVGKVPYGLPELFGDELREAQIVANPGCYPTSAILPLAPLLSAGAIDPADIVVDSKSGVSGAGRTLRVGSLYCEANESIAAYGVGSHRHQPEIDDILGRYSGERPQVLFTPHLTPMDRGILSTIYVRPRSTDADGVLRLWRELYAEAPFVHVVDHLPATKHVAGTNHVQMAVRQAGDRLVLLCVVDNLTKGASGAAVQNLNRMFGLPETLGLGGKSV